MGEVPTHCDQAIHQQLAHLFDDCKHKEMKGDLHLLKPHSPYMKQATGLCLSQRTSEAILSKGFFAPGDG